MAGMSKSNAIRLVAMDSDLSHSNGWFVREVQRRYGLDVLSSQVIDVLGPWQTRRVNGRAFEVLVQMAQKLRDAAGSKAEALKALHQTRAKGSAAGDPTSVDSADKV